MKAEVFSNHNQNYRPEIDGLRAFAVIAVIINHLNKNALPSGYLGVDIFFVISGFVITSSLINRTHRNFKDFIFGFYERRVKRILPSLILFVVINVILISLFNPNSGISWGTGIRSLLGFSNIYLIQRSTDYFANTTDLNIFAHTWSLGVEEQFYFLFPFLFWFTGCNKGSKSGTRRLLKLLLIISIFSVVSFFILYKNNPALAYFSMPTRFWEISIGSIVCLSIKEEYPLTKKLNELPSSLLLVLIFIIFLMPTYLGVLSTTFVILLSSLLIYSFKFNSNIYKIFSHPKVTYIGLISYSLYLWHWGIICISRWTIGIHWWTIPFQLILMFLIALFSYKYVESPIRRAKLPFNSFLNLIFGMFITFFSVLGVTIFGIKYKDSLYLGSDLNLSKYAGEKYITTKDCPEGAFVSKEFLLKQCSVKSKNNKNLISIGDSQSHNLKHLFNLIHEEYGHGIFYYSTNNITFPAALTLEVNSSSTKDSFLMKYANFEEALNYYLENSSIGDLLILPSRFSFVWGEVPIPRMQRKTKFNFYDKKGLATSKEEAFKEWKSKLMNLVKKSKEKGVNVVIFSSIPEFTDFLNPITTDPQWFNKLQKEEISIKRQLLIDNYKNLEKSLFTLSSNMSNLYYFNIFDSLCPPSFESCTPKREKIPLYKDQWHLSNKGINFIYSDFKKFLEENSLI